MERKHLFEDLKRIMFAFGDKPNPDDKTVKLMEEILYDFIDRIIKKSIKRSHGRGMYNKILKDDIFYLIRKNEKYALRMAYILQNKYEVSTILRQTNDNGGVL